MREVLKDISDNSIHCVVTSPPYFGLRDYGEGKQIGLEQTPREYVNAMVGAFREIKRVLRNDGTAWLNLGDTYAANRTYQVNDSKWTDVGNKKGMSVPEGLKPKDLMGIPWRVAFGLQDDGWYLRSDIIWEKPNCMPESVKDRPTRSHEYVFLLSNSQKYFYDADAIKEPYESAPTTKVRDKHGEGYQADYTNGDRFSPGARDYYANGGRNKRTVWKVATKPFKGSHFAVFPPDLIKPCVLAGCPKGGVILDPFGGSGTVSMVAEQLGRNSVYIDLNEKYREMAVGRIKSVNENAEIVII